MTYRIPTTFVGWTHTNSIPTSVVGRHIPSKLVGTAYFDKSYVLQGILSLDENNE